MRHACNYHVTCIVQATTLQHACNHHARCMHPSCNMRVIIMQHASCMQPLCNMHATIMHHACTHNASCIQPPCNMHVTIMKHACNHHATCALWEYIKNISLFILQNNKLLPPSPNEKIALSYTRCSYDILDDLPGYSLLGEEPRWSPLVHELVECFAPAETLFQCSSVHGGETKNAFVLSIIIDSTDDNVLLMIIFRIHINLYLYLWEKNILSTSNDINNIATVYADNKYFNYDLYIYFLY